MASKIPSLSLSISTLQDKKATAIVEMSLDSLSKHTIESFGSHGSQNDHVKSDQLCSIAAMTESVGVPSLSDDALLECQSLMPGDELSYLCSHGAKLVLEETESDVKDLMNPRFVVLPTTTTTDWSLLHLGQHNFEFRSVSPSLTSI